MNTLIFLLYFALIEKSVPKKETTLSAYERVDALKRKIKQEIRDKQNRGKSHFTIPDEKDFSDNYDYVDMESIAITPIMDNDVRKIKERYKLPQLKTSIMPAENKKKDINHKTRKGKKNSKEEYKNETQKKVQLKTRHSKPIEVFYRRHIMDINEPSEWAHCQDLITPHLNGMKSDIKSLRRLTSRDPDVTRFIYLLTTNTTNLSKDEIYSIMYQISNLQIRLFQWDVTAIYVVMNVIVKGAGHNFQNLKHGLKGIFASWFLDMSNTTNLLKQARIFRPPCVRVSEYDGSTKSSRGIRYTKSEKEIKCPPDYGDDCKDT